MKNGTSFEWREKTNRGGPENPMPRGEIVEKFYKNARKAISEKQCARVVEKIENLEKMGNITMLMRALKKGDEVKNKI